MVTGDVESAGYAWDDMQCYSEAEDSSLSYDEPDTEINFGSWERGVACWERQWHRASQWKQRCLQNVQPRFLRPTVLLLPVGRSGSFLFQAHLDAHPDVLNVPGAFLKDFVADKIVGDWLAEVTTVGQLRSAMQRIAERYEVLFDTRSARKLPNPIIGSGKEEGRLAGYHSLGPQRDRILRGNGGQALLTVSLDCFGRGLLVVRIMRIM